VKLVIEIIVFVIVASGLLLVFFPNDWIMALRIRSARKSLADGKETLAMMETFIAEIKGKLATKPEATEQFAPVLKSLEAQRDSLIGAIQRFTERLQYVEELRAVVNNKSYTPEEANSAILKLTDPKLDEFLKQLNGDK
jgi:hypothetical protein